MRVVIAMMKHETNTFSPVPTPIERFAKAQPLPYEGQEVYDAFKGTGSGVGAYIDLAEAAGAEMVFPIAANAPPSGPVHDDAYKYITDKICAAVEDGCDAILLDLHGAMVTQSMDDGEGALLTRLREIAPEVPMAVTLDMHTNMYPAIADNATLIAGYQTYPHIDNYETAARAGKPVFALLRGEGRPALAWGNRPMLPHVMRQGT
ncbi:MAG: M81 family metallopeptidase, partial [Alphaproteobacteria bacterium]|nr:M81 family metallopeptidase [Alphaproteobacteria bacterium]